MTTTSPHALAALHVATCDAELILAAIQVQADPGTDS